MWLVSNKTLFTNTGMNLEGRGLLILPQGGTGVGWFLVPRPSAILWVISRALLSAEGGNLLPFLNHSLGFHVSPSQRAPQMPCRTLATLALTGVTPTQPVALALGFSSPASVPSASEGTEGPAPV